MDQVLRGKRIFYAEDDVKNQSGLWVVLRGAGADIKIGREYDVSGIVRALKWSLPLDLIVLDLMYPRGMTGYDILAAIKQDLELRDIPVIAFSAADPSEEIPRVRKAGMNGFIAKPMNVQKIASQMAEVINGNEIWYEGILTDLH